MATKGAAVGASLDDSELALLTGNKEDGYNNRERRQDEWLENYTYYRGKITINRLTQRQSVHVPLMKQVIRSLIKDVDDMPVLYFENIDNDKQKELFKNEYWKWTAEQNHLEEQDIVDKKQVFLFGRSFDQWQIADGRVVVTRQDPQDILVSRYTDPVDLNSSRFLIHTHIYRTLTELEANPDYSREAIAYLKDWYQTEQGLIKVEDNKKAWVDKEKKMREMGVPDVASPVLGETVFEISLHFVKRQTGGDDFEQIWLYVEAENQVILMKQPLEAVIGTTKDHFWRNHFPYTTWADDLERQDFWSDGIADIIRPNNKVLDAWLSQLVENRTLRNFGMNYYDSTANEGNWSPNTYNPTPWGWYAIPGNPNDLVKRVEIPELSESLDEMKFIIEMVEKTTGSTPTQQGNISERQVTLGEVQLALGEAKERVKGMSKFYTPAWKRRGEIFLKLLEAAPEKLDAVKIQAKGRNTDDLYEREISPKDWQSQSGYRCKVWTQDEKDTRDTLTIQKLDAVKKLMPTNAKLDEIYKRKLLEFADLTPEETNQVMTEEIDRMDIIQQQLAQGGMPGVQPGGGSAPPPAQPAPAPRMAV